MIKFKSATGRWYHCPHCWNYSVRAMMCCGEPMAEEEDEEDYRPVLAYTNDN